MKESFHWGAEFETGLPDIDNQHHHLVDLINQFSEMVIDFEVDEKNVAMLFAELTDYTHYHFRDEEMLMEKTGLHPAFVNNHKNIHKGFIEQLENFKQHSRLGSPDDWQSLLEFLYAWLVYHILGQDRDMARQIALVESGKSPAEARDEVVKTSGNGQIESLLHALHSLVEMLTRRNVELDVLNRTLEAKVSARTAELEAANSSLEALSLTDMLTGLPNRRHAMQKLGVLWKEAARDNTSLACLMIDADYFKEVNDTFGHDAGDKVLKQIAQVLRENIRTDDFVARLGGDEFLVICPQTGMAGALELANHLLARVKQVDLRFSVDGGWRSSVSIGVAEKTAGMPDIVALMAKADDSLYQAKHSGRGRVSG